MSVRITADPDRLDVYAEEVAQLASITLTETADDYQAAIRAFNAAGPNDLGSRVPDRSEEVRDAVDDLLGLGRMMGGFAAALRQIDAGSAARMHGAAGLRSAPFDDGFATLVAANTAMPGATAAQAREFADTLRDAASGDASALERLKQAGNTVLLAVKTVEALESARDAGTSALRSLVHAWRLLHAAVDLDLARNPDRNIWGSISSPAHLPEQNRVLQARLAVRQFRHERAAAAAIPRLRDAVTNHTVALRGSRPLTGIGDSLAARFPRTMSTLGKSGRALGAVGVGLNFYDGYRDIQEEDWGGVVSNGAAIAGSVLMVNPITAPIGAALVVGSLIYEHRSFLGDVGRSIGNVLWG